MLFEFFKRFLKKNPAVPEIQPVVQEPVAQPTAEVQPEPKKPRKPRVPKPVAASTPGKKSVLKRIK